MIGFGLLFVIRPVVGWLALWGSGMNHGDRLIVGFFGVRGIGSIYYVGYATGHMEFINESQLWALVTNTIFASAILHGTTGFLVDRFVSKDAGPSKEVARSGPEPNLGILLQMCRTHLAANSPVSHAHIELSRAPAIAFESSRA